MKRYYIYDEVIKNTILDNHMEGKDAIRYFCTAYLEYFQNYPEITTVMFSFDIFKYNEEANEKMKSIIKNRYDLLYRLVSEANEKNEGLIGKEVQALTDSIFSSLRTITFLWRMENCNFDVKERVLLAIDYLINFKRGEVNEKGFDHR